MSTTAPISEKVYAKLKRYADMKGYKYVTVVDRSVESFLRGVKDA